ncbi:MAG TPA: hypothetical protein PKD79_00790 [Candidatus Doudnabacteria bacterium]|nr:hypothetical protein [Candidatus Doudnabacteria bacterium]
MIKHVIAVSVAVATFAIGTFFGTFLSEPAQANPVKIQTAVPVRPIINKSVGSVPIRPTRVSEETRNMITARVYEGYSVNRKTYSATSKALTDFSGRNAEQMADTVQFSFELAKKFAKIREEIQKHGLTQEEVGSAEKDSREMELELYRIVIKGLDHIAATGKTSMRGIWKGGGFHDKAYTLQTKEKVQEWFIDPLL